MTSSVIQWQVSKPTLKTRAFQEACVFSVVEELADHLAQWSYSVAFLEFSFIPAVRLRNFCKSTKIERFRREMRQLIHNVCIFCGDRLFFKCLGFAVTEFDLCQLIVFFFSNK